MDKKIFVYVKDFSQAWEAIWNSMVSNMIEFEIENTGVEDFYKKSRYFDLTMHIINSQNSYFIEVSNEISNFKYSPNTNLIFIKIFKNKETEYKENLFIGFNIHFLKNFKDAKWRFEYNLSTTEIKTLNIVKKLFSKRCSYENKEITNLLEMLVREYLFNNELY